MKTFLKVCLLLGVAATLIPSAFGLLQCVECGSSGWMQDCEDYKEGIENFVTACSPSFGENAVCTTNKTKDIEFRSCGPREAGMKTKMECHMPGNSGYCQCDNHLCNAPTRGGGSGQTPGGIAGQRQGCRSGQQRALKGQSFEILGMVHLGGVWLIRRQLWG